MTHPNAIALEAFACGEPSAAVEAHLSSCASCNDFVERARQLTAPKAASNVVPIFSKARKREQRAAWGGGSVVLLAVAAAVALYVKTTPGTGAIAQNAVPTSTASTVTTGSALAVLEPDTTFKGGPLVAVIRERDGKQERFTETVKIRPKDRLRIEVALDRSQAILGAVIGEDGSYLEVLSSSVRGAGTHFSEKSIRIDESPLSGTIVVGAPDTISRARATRTFAGTSDMKSLRVEWETP